MGAKRRHNSYLQTNDSSGDEQAGRRQISVVGMAVEDQQSEEQGGIGLVEPLEQSSCFKFSNIVSNLMEEQSNWEIDQ